MTQQQIENFLNGLTELSRKYHIKINDGGGCCQPTLEEMTEQDLSHKYSCDKVKGLLPIYFFSGLKQTE